MMMTDDKDAIAALEAELEAAKRDAELLRDAANRIEGDDVLARLRSGNATPEDQYNVANSLAYLWAQDGLLSEAQQEVGQLRDQLAEVERQLDKQMARLNANLLAANWARMDAERELYAARADAELLWANCRVIYFPDPAGSYPLEHNMRACGTKDSRADIEAALRIDAAMKD